MIDKDKILVSKKTDTILISYDGKKLIIDKDNSNELFNILKDMSKKQIRDWYVSR